MQNDQISENINDCHVVYTYSVQVLTIANPAHRILNPLNSKGASSDKNQAKKGKYYNF